MAGRKRLPVGVDIFEKLIRENYYYLDKTSFIKELMASGGDVNLFTRPRRFGKTLLLTTLQAFFELGGEPDLFDGLDITKERALCEEYQGRFPVIFLSLKAVEGSTYEEAMEKLGMFISVEYRRHCFLEKSDRVDDYDKEMFRQLSGWCKEGAVLQFSLKILMRMLHAHYGQKVILLIDEYDVPLDKSCYNGYYDKMVMFFRTFFGEAFKTNPHLQLAVITGCLRISKESIFTGINNLKVDGISDDRFDEYFGFTEKNVRTILEDYGLAHAYDSMKEWYDGYHFGEMDVYCPWDVLCYCDNLLASPKAKPKAYWNNTSSNEIVKRFIHMADAATRDAIERLIAGEGIEIAVTENLTYAELEESIDNLWSVLYLTGYLTRDRRQEAADEEKVRLVIPNREVRTIFIEKIQKWFAKESVPLNQKGIYEALWKGDAESLQERLRLILLDTISYYDYHENYYHAFLAGMLLEPRYIVRSNREMGTGRSDIVVEDARNRRAILLEVKRSKGYENLEEDSQKALEQIADKQYGAPYLIRNYTVYAYGIAFFEKDCQAKTAMMARE